ncbi:hypothetical protein SLS62_002586 [Diatrype stigma]|uniref:Bola-like protein n=1 Tax=Diatrype stigma TaxID=117547 RepID=A0AAN9YVG7_9PEZI
MLCANCRRLALTAATRQIRTKTPSHLRRFATSPATNQAKAWLQQTSNARSTTLPARRYPYSTSASPATAPFSSSAPASSPSPSTPEKPDFLDRAESEIWDKLTAEFAPTELMVQDISGGCGSMYGIEITSEKFRGANMLKQQRMVNAVLGEQMKGWHGVQLRTKVPS